MKFVLILCCHHITFVNVYFLYTGFVFYQITPQGYTRYKITAFLSEQRNPK